MSASITTNLHHIPRSFFLQYKANEFQGASYANERILISLVGNRSGGTAGTCVISKRGQE